MSIEQFGTIISLHNQLAGLLHEILDKRAIMNTEYELKDNVLRLASTLFGTNIGGFDSLMNEARRYNDAYIDWLETRSRAISQFSHEWASGTESIEDDRFVAVYIIRPIREMESASESAVRMLTSSIARMKPLEFQDTVTAVSLFRAGRYAALDACEISPVSLSTRDENADILTKINIANDATMPNTTWADNNTLWLVGRYTANNRLTFNNLCPLLNNCIATSVTLTFANTVAGVYSDRARVPPSGSLQVGTAAASPRYPINRMIELGIKLSSEMIVMLPNNHGLNVNDIVVVAITGKFILKTCGNKELLTANTMFSEHTIGIPNFGFGNTIMYSRANCTTAIEDTASTAYLAVYDRLMERLRPAVGSAGYMLSGTVHQPSLLYYTLFGGTQPLQHPLTLANRKMMAFTMTRVATVINGLGLYSGL